MTAFHRALLATLLWTLTVMPGMAQSARLADENRARDLNNQAASLHNNHKYKEALRLYAKVLTLNPRAAVYYNNRAAARTEVGDLAGALADYDTALRLDPTPAVFYSNRAALLIKRSDLEHAVADYNIAVAHEPKTGFFRQERGKARSQAGDKDGALEDFREAYRLDPKLAFAKERSKSLSQELSSPPAEPAPAPAEPAPTETKGMRRIALVIGNSSYESIRRLNNPQQDAERIASTLRAAGFSSVETVLDGSLDQMSAALDRFGIEAAKADWAVIYYSGHGAEAAGVNYLLPVDFKLKNDIDLQAGAIPLDRALSALQRASTLRLVILDACRNDPFKGSVQRTIRTHVVAKGLAPAPTNLATSGLAVAYAAKGGEEASDGPPGGNSPFAMSLAKRIDQPHVELGMLFRLVRDDVLHETGRKQEPYVYGSLPSEELYIHP